MRSLEIQQLEKDRTMNAQLQGAGMQVVNGFLFGSGIILAAMLFKAVLHAGFCG